MFIAALLVVDSFFICYAIGLNSKHIAVVDHALPPVVVPTAPAAQESPAGGETQPPAGI